MPRPGWDVVIADAPVPRSVPTDTGVAFFVGATEKGPEGPTVVRSLAGYEDTYGARTGGIDLFDAVDAYFREGGSRLYVSAVPTTPDVKTLVGPMGQSVPAPDGMEEKPARRAKAKSDDGDEKASVGATLFDPTTIGPALDAIPASLGPGQVCVPGGSTSAIAALVLEHAATHNRLALLDAPPGSDAAAIEAYADTLRTELALAASPMAGRFAALVAPQAVIPGVAPGTTRACPWSAILAGLIARSDAASQNANVAAAGVNGNSIYSLALSDQFTDDEYTALNEAGVCCAQYRYGNIQNYGYVTLVDRNEDELWWWLGGSRVVMAIVAEAGQVAEGYVFSQLDGQGLRVNEFGGDLRGMLVPYYEQGALYGETAQDAFRVEVGAGVNTPESLAAGELHAVLHLRTSPGSEYVEVTIVKVATTEALQAAA